MSENKHGTYSYSLKFILDTKTVCNGNTHPIYAQVIVRRQKAIMALHEYASPDKFDSKIGRIINPNRFEKSLNERILDIENQINEIRHDLERAGVQVTAKAIKQQFKYGHQEQSVKLLDFFNQQVQLMSEKKLHADNTLKHYTICSDKLQAYLKSIESEHLSVDKISIKHLHGFYEFMLKNVQVNTAINNMKKLRAILNIAIKKEFIITNPFSQYKMSGGTKSDRVALTAEECEAISKYPLDNQSLIKVRDLFMFSVYTGLRFSDAQNLTVDKIKKDGNDRYWIEIVQEKTNRLVQIPLLAPAREIFEKYKDYQENTKRALPAISNQKLNSYLKVIANLVGISQAKSLSHHVARHTYATTILLENGADIKTVSDMMGHYNIGSTQGYLKTTRKTLSKVAESIDEALAI